MRPGSRPAGAPVSRQVRPAIGGGAVDGGAAGLVGDVDDLVAAGPVPRWSTDPGGVLPCLTTDQTDRGVPRRGAPAAQPGRRPDPTKGTDGSAGAQMHEVLAAGGLREPPTGGERDDGAGRHVAVRPVRECLLGLLGQGHHGDAGKAGECTPQDGAPNMAAGYPDGPTPAHAGAGGPSISRRGAPAPRCRPRHRSRAGSPRAPRRSTARSSRSRPR